MDGRKRKEKTNLIDIHALIRLIKYRTLGTAMQLKSVQNFRCRAVFAAKRIQEAYEKQMGQADQGCMPARMAINRLWLAASQISSSFPN
ncbi:Hypothetical predicted protein [Podarcis lilfordi]|uniref:Uncharacterized protein n=1 Tax=Podarcis lilfordi TaxID=74358 RepID=A0AA35P4A3_9SAUR|nr:Hypothetical predicted protein [Podarcis lilfordi]